MVSASEMDLENINPQVFEKLAPVKFSIVDENADQKQREPTDTREVFDLICNIKDPEHPMTLEELAVVQLKNIQVDKQKREVMINFTPTIPHCSMATLIGLCIRVKLLRSLASCYKVSVEITPGTHASEHAINKQLADKERIAAAMENKHLCGVINQCISENGLQNNHFIGFVHKFVDEQNKKEAEEQGVQFEYIPEVHNPNEYLKEINMDLYENQIMMDEVFKEINEPHHTPPPRFDFEVDDSDNSGKNVLAFLNFLSNN